MLPSSVEVLTLLFGFPLTLLFGEKEEIDAYNFTDKAGEGV